jgi:hypothetical protein
MTVLYLNCCFYANKLFLAMGEAYQIRDQEIEHDEIIT